MSGLVLAIDGPSGSGKSSTAKAIALRANWSYLDTGALYRAATYIALANQERTVSSAASKCMASSVRKPAPQYQP